MIRKTMTKPMISKLLFLLLILFIFIIAYTLPVTGAMLQTGPGLA